MNVSYNLVRKYLILNLGGMNIFKADIKFQIVWRFVTKTRMNKMVHLKKNVDENR